MLLHQVCGGGGGGGNMFWCNISLLPAFLGICSGQPGQHSPEMSELVFISGKYVIICHNHVADQHQLSLQLDLQRGEHDTQDPNSENQGT